MDVLMAYARKNGSTQQVAEAIAAAMRDHGARAALVRAGTRRDPRRAADGDQSRPNVTKIDGSTP